MSPVRSRLRPHRGGLVAVLVVLAVLVSGCSGGSGMSRQASDKGYVAGDGTYTVIAAKDRRAPVVLTGTTLDGKSLDLASFRGKPVVINVWGSWCAPCRKEAPDLQQASVELQKQDIPLIGINTQDATAQAQAFEREFKITYPSLDDADGTALLALRGAVSPKAIPTTLVLDAQGRIAARSLTAIDKNTLLGLVQDATKA